MIILRDHWSSCIEKPVIAMVQKRQLKYRLVDASRGNLVVDIQGKRESLGDNIVYRTRMYGA